MRRVVRQFASYPEDAAVRHGLLTLLCALSFACNSVVVTHLPVADSTVCRQGTFPWLVWLPAFDHRIYINTAPVDSAAVLWYIQQRLEVRPDSMRVVLFDVAASRTTDARWIIRAFQRAHATAFRGPAPCRLGPPGILDPPPLPAGKLPN